MSLVSKIPEQLLNKYELSVINSLPESKRELIPTMTAEELEEFIDFYSKSTKHYGYHRQYLASPTPFVKPYQNEKWEPLNGYYELDSLFVHEMRSLGYLHSTSPQEYNTVTRGVATDFSEVMNHLEYLYYGNHVTSSEVERIRSELLRNDFIINIQRSDDQSLFRSLRHVGLWGTELFNQSSVSASNELDKVRMLARPYSQLNEFHEGLYRRMKIEGASSGAINEYTESFKKYHQEHESFIFFEILLLNHEYGTDEEKVSATMPVMNELV